MFFKKFILWLITIFLLGQMPLGEWNKLSEIQQTKFLKYLGQLFIQQEDCKKALIGALEKNGEVYFTAECLSEEEEI